MKRHSGLRQLSRDHHQALVLARRLRGPGEGEPALAAARDACAAAVGPHFAVEERELLPLCHGAGESLAGHAETVRQDHAALRALFAGLSSGSWPHAAGALAERLESHVRFEERVWFPALEAVLDEATLASLEWRLDPEPRPPITSLHPDETEPAGAWVATLACGHTQHIRHRPPFQNVSGVTTPEGRERMLGTRLACRLCLMPRLPPRAACYKETPVFDQDSVPAGLLARHSLRAGTWGQIVVLEGRVDYVIEDAPGLAFVLRPGVDGAVAPEQPHHVRLQPGARFKVRFLR